LAITPQSEAAKRARASWKNQTRGIHKADIELLYLKSRGEALGNGEIIASYGGSPPDLTRN
jgi:hypothetical protein